MTYIEAIRQLESLAEHCKTMQDEPEDIWEDDIKALEIAIKSIKHEVYWEDVKQTFDKLLNNSISPFEALLDIYRAYMGRGDINNE